MTTTPPPGAPGDRLAAAVNYAIGALQQSSGGYARGLAAALLLSAGLDRSQPMPLLTVIRAEGMIAGISLQPLTDATAGACCTARESVESAWQVLSDAGQWGDRDMLIQSGPHGGSVVPVCSPGATDVDLQRREFLVGAIEGLRIIWIASQ